MYSILLQAQAAPNQWTGTLFMIGGIVIVMYFFMIRPQQKKAKDQKKFKDEIKRGDLVITIGGIHGRVIAQEEDTITLEVDKNIKLKFEKSAISLESTKKIQSGVPTSTAVSTPL